MTRNRLILSMLVPQMAIVSAVAADKRATDDYINDSVRQKLAVNQVVKGGDLTVEVKDGVVTISGKVNEQKKKDRAERLAKKVHGVNNGD